MRNIKIFFLALILSFSFSFNIIPVQALEASKQNTINFDLESTIYNYGEAIDKVILDISSLNVDETSLNTDTFKVLATATSPYKEEQLDGMKHTGLYENVERTITNISCSNGKIILDLNCSYGMEGQSTLDFVYKGLTGANLSMDVKYKLSLKKPILLKNGEKINDLTFSQKNIINAEVDKFSTGEFDRLKYQLYKPENASDKKKHPLIIWFHGGGESGYKGMLYNNTSQLKGNRGAVTFTTAEAQKIFDGAYILAPQVPDEWSNHLNDTKALIDKIVNDNEIDKNRIYVYGCSAGGYMTIEMVVKNPGFFAAAVATCPAIDQQNIDTYGEGRKITDKEISSITSTKIWLVQAKNDSVVKYEEGALRIYNLLKDKGAILTTYDNVVVDGVEYPGHFSWIYTALNMPNNNGESVWQWTARQSLESGVRESVKVGYNTIIGLCGLILILVLCGIMVFRRKRKNLNS